MLHLSKRGISSGALFRKVTTYFVLFVVSMLFIVPLWLTVSTSLKYEGNIMRIPTLFPNPFTLDNYAALLKQYNFILYAFNSIKISLLGTIGQLLSCSLAAYAFARLRFPGKNVLFAILISTMMIPEQVTLIPTFLIFRSIGLFNTHTALILPDFLGKAFGIFLLRQFFVTLPKELDEAARIDGCSTFRIYAQIYMPLAKPALASLAIFSWMGQWNDLLRPVVYLTSNSLRTLTVSMSLFQTQEVTRYGMMMAGAIICIIPLLLVFLFGQKYIIAGIASTGIKG